MQSQLQKRGQKQALICLFELLRIHARVGRAKCQGETQDGAMETENGRPMRRGEMYFIYFV